MPARKRWCRECREEGRRTEAVPVAALTRLFGYGRRKWVYADRLGRLREMPLCRECRDRLDCEADQDAEQEVL